MSTGTHSEGQIVQYRKVGKFELVKLMSTTESGEEWLAQQLTGKRAKCSPDGRGRIWVMKAA